MRLSGVGRDRMPLAICAWEAGGGAGEGQQIAGRADQPERRGETALPDSPAIKGRITPARLPAGITTPGKCVSHLGLGQTSEPSVPSDHDTSVARYSRLAVSGGDKETVL